MTPFRIAGDTATNEPEPRVGPRRSGDQPPGTLRARSGLARLAPRPQAGGVGHSGNAMAVFVTSWKAGT